MEKTDDWGKGKEQSFSAHFGESAFSLFDNLISLNTFNSIAVIVAVALETVIYIDTFLLFVDSSLDKDFNDLYFWLNYLDPTYSLVLVKYAIYAIVGTLSFGFFFLLIIVVLFVFNWVHTGSGSDGRHSLAHTYMLRIAGILVVSVRVVLLQPMLTVLLLATLCTTDGFHIQIDGLGYDCSGSLQTILMVLGILTAVLLISAVALTIVFFADEDPRSRLPWACGSRAVDAYKLIRKAVTSLGVYVATGNSAVGTAIIAVCLILSVLIMMSLYNQLYMQDRNLLYITITTEGLVTWLTLLLVAQTISDVDWLHPVGMGVFVAVFLVCVVLAYRSRCANFMRRHSIESFKRADDVETYSRILLDHLRISKTGDDPTVNGFIQMHFLSCKNDRCPCRKRTDCCDRTEEEVKLQSGNEKEVEEADVGFKKSKSAMDFDAGTKKGNVVVKSEAAADRAKTEVLKIVINSLEAWKERHESSARFDIYLGHLKSAVWKNRLAALYEVMCAQNESPSVYELFMAYRLTRKIEEQLSRQEGQGSMSSEIDNMIVFQKVLADMQEDMQEVLKKFIGFWKELQDESPNFEYIGTISNEISQRVTQIRADYRSLIAANPSNLYCRMLYAIFLRNVVKDEFEAFDVYDETTRASNNIRIQNAHANDRMYEINNKTGLFIISGEKATVGQVLNINNEVLELLGHEKNEVVGQNISRMMPPIIGEKHSAFVTNYLRSGKGNKKTEQMALALHKQGYIVPCAYIHREMPSLRHGLQFIGFLHKITDFSPYCPIAERNVGPDDMVLLLTDQNWVMHAFNIKAAKLFSIDPSQSSSLRKYIHGERKIQVTKLVPQLEDVEFVRNVRLSLSTDVTIDPAAIRRVIDSEIETSRPTQVAAADPMGLAKRSESEKTLLMLADNSTLRGPLSLSELQYGTQDESSSSLRLRLVAIYLEQLQDKDNRTMDSTADLLMQKKNKKDNALIDDLASQSSNSSASAEQGQKSVRRFKESIKQQKSPFFTRCFIKLGILVFLMILSAAVVEFVLVDRFIQLIYTGSDNSDTFYQRIAYVFRIANNFRAIYDMYQQYETESSPLYSDRLAAYVAMITDDSEKLRLCQNKFINSGYVFKPEHAAVINSPLVQFTMGPDKLSQTGDSTTENYTINVAIVQYVAKATELLQYDIASIRAGQSAANATFDYDIVRLFNFMILNGRGTLPYYGEIMYGWYNQEVTDEIDYRYSAILITIIIDPLILFALMVAFIPFILSVQTRLLQIYIHLCKFKESDVRSWLESCNNSVADIKASAAAIRKVYGNTSFDVNVSMFEEEEKKGSNMKSTDRLGKGMHPPAKKQPMEDTKENQHSQNTQQPVPTSTFAGGMTITNKETNDLLVSTGVVPAGEATDEEKSRLAEILRSKEDDVAERKQKIFSQITRQKTMTYLLYLAFFAIYIGAFRIADILVFMTVYNYNTTTLTLYSTLTNRYLSGLRAEVFFREEIYANTPMSYFSLSDATEFYADRALEAELTYSRSRAGLTGRLVSFADYISALDLDQLCDKIATDTDYLTQCRTAYSGLAQLGLNTVIGSTLNLIKKTHARFLLEYKTNPSYALSVINSDDIVMISDIRNRIIKPGTFGFMTVYYNIQKDWTNYYLSVNKLKFALYIVFMLFIFALLWNKMVANMRNDIEKTLGILNVLPTVHLSSSPDFIKELNASSLIR